MGTNRRLALMIDGDNAQAALLPQMLAEVSKYGVMTIRRVYGDWTEANMKSWKDVLHSYALQPVQQFRYTQGKNATDSALIIDAMDIIYTADVNGVCIVSSDSDYTRLATRIREKNLFVMGIGKNITPPSFVNACDIFVHTENLQPIGDIDLKTEPAASDKTAISDTTPKKKVATNTKTATTSAQSKNLKKLKGLMRTAFDSAVQEDGWATLAAMGDFLRKLDPSFDSRTYGRKSLSQLVADLPDFIELKKDKTNQGGVYIRLK
ncbi:MAG: NYN domain-containing protein [Anaerolineae bacterium]|nr:NYN domain-containing protein [Anaerolineae bacterium]